MLKRQKRSESAEEARSRESVSFRLAASDAVNPFTLLRSGFSITTFAPSFSLRLIAL